MLLWALSHGRWDGQGLVLLKGELKLLGVCVCVHVSVTGWAMGAGIL